MNAKQFLLQTRLTSWDLEVLAQAASSSGYHFTTDELLTAADELWGNLSEEQLRSVTGGGKPDNPGNPNDHDNDGTWSPPPGEISNNSCFFTRGGNS